MATTRVNLDRQAESRVFDFGTTSASGEGLVTIYKGTAAASTVVLDVKGSQNIAGDLTLTGNLNLTGNINETSVTNLTVTDLTITVNNGGSTPTDDTSGLIVEGTGDALVGALYYKGASATKWSVGTGAAQQDIVGTTATQTLTNKTLTSPVVNTPTGIVKGDVGLGNVDNTADAAKAVLSATKWTTARNLAGNSVDGSANVAFANKFIVQGTTDTGLSDAQFLGALGTGIVKNTTSTGVLSIAIAADFPTLNQNTTGSAATLTTPRAINGTNFDGSAAITITAAAGTLTGTTLNATVVTSSLTSVGVLTGGTWNATAVTVPYGGTGAASFTAYAPIFGGTTSTGTLQSGTVGTAGQVLTSNGAGALPTFQAVSSSVYHRATAVTGTQDSANKTFAIANAVSAGSEQIFVNGILKAPGSSNDYVLTGTALVFQAGYPAPTATDVIRAYGSF
jgi:hypothetical protein